MRNVRWIAAASAAATLLLASACGGQAASKTNGTGDGKPEQSTIKAGVLPLADYAAVYWAKDHGFFEREGLNVTLEPLQGGPIGVQKVASGELQFSFSNSISSTIAVSKGAPVVTVALTASLGPNTNTIFVKPDSPIKDITGLNGKTIGVNTVNNIGDVMFKNLVTAKGLDVKPQWVEVPFPEMIAGVKNNSIEAGYLPEPFASAALAAGLRPVVDLTSGPNEAVPAATFVTSQAYAKSHPNTVAAFQRAMSAASKDMASKEAEFRTWLPTVSQTKPEAAAVMKLPIFESDVSVAKMQRVADILIALKLVEKGYDAAKSTVVPRG